MTATVTETDQWVVSDGKKYRVWHGLTGEGSEIWLLVAGVGVPDGEKPPPGEFVQVVQIERPGRG